jgi:hypothetical protein
VSAAPDYCEPVVGWRARSAVDGGSRTRLSSVVYSTIWPTHGVPVPAIDAATPGDVIDEVGALAA